MSIFQAKDWWSAKVGDDEEFDTNNIALGNVDNSLKDEDKIVVGSFEGKLRIYSPNKANNGKYSPEDLIIEKDLQIPILQVSIGKFSKGKGFCLAVLSTRVLLLFEVESSNNFSKLLDLSQHRLERNAYNFIHGFFGKDSTMEQIIVQSVDGALFFIENERMEFKILLANYLIPGPLVYSKNAEAILIANSNLEIESYSYESMKIFTNNDIERQKEEQIKDNKKLSPGWTCNIGEQARQITLHNNRYTGAFDVVVLGEHSIFVLNELNGKIRYQKRFNFSPSCFHSYHLTKMGADLCPLENETVELRMKNFGRKANSPGFMTLMGSFEGFLLVYKDIKLAWTTKL